MRCRVWFCIFAIMVLCTTDFALAASSQGLSWGVEEDQEIGFVYSRTNSQYPELDSSNIQIYMRVGSLPEIPDTVSSFSFSATVSFYNASGSSFGLAIPIAIHFVLPVGNWELIDTLAESALAGSGYDSVAMIDELSNWGYTVSELSPGYRIEFTVKYNKGDGAISSVAYEKTDLDAMDLDASLSIERAGIISLPPWGGAVIYAAIVIVALILLCRWCRKPNS